MIKVNLLVYMPQPIRYVVCCMHSVISERVKQARHSQGRTHCVAIYIYIYFFLLKSPV